MAPPHSMRYLIGLAVLLLAACTDVPSPPPIYALPTVGLPTAICRSIGLDGVLEGDAEDPRIAWLVPAEGGRQDLIWPQGYAARFAPNLEIVDGQGRVMLRAGDAILRGCTAGPANNPASIILVELDP